MSGLRRRAGALKERQPRGRVSPRRPTAIPPRADAGASPSLRRLGASHPQVLKSRQQRVDAYRGRLTDRKRSFRGVSSGKEQAGPILGALVLPAGVVAEGLPLRLI